MRRGGWLILVAALCLLAVLAMGRCQLPVGAAVSTSTPWPSWTPRPTATPRVYQSWTPLPTATRKTATPTRTVNPTATPTVDLWATSLPSPTSRPCYSAWVFSQAERYRIQAAAVYADPPERDLIPYNDMLCGIGLWDNDLGMPTTAPFAVEGDVDGSKILCRGFCMGVVAVMQMEGMDAVCQDWAILRWSGEARE